MEMNEMLRNSLFETVDEQIRLNDPPETKMTYDRLIGERFDDFTAHQLIAQCILFEMVEVMNGAKKVDNDRMIRHLNDLPKEPMGK